MSALSLVGGVRSPAAAQPDGVGALRGGGRLREYWIQADSFERNLVPKGRDGMTGSTFTADQTSYWAIGHRAYAPGWRGLPAGNASIGGNTGIPGPTIRAHVGDRIRVHFRNNDTHYGSPHSIHPHGVLYDPLSDGAWLAIEPDKPGTAVAVGETYTYEYRAAASSVGTWPTTTTRSPSR